MNSNGKPGEPLLKRIELLPERELKASAEED